MEAYGVFAFIATICAFGMGVCAYTVAITWMRQRTLGTLPTETGMRDGLKAWVLRNGISALIPLSRPLLAHKRFARFIQDAVIYATESGFTTSSEAMTTVVLTALAVLFVLGSVATISIPGGIAIAGCAIVVAAYSFRAHRERAQARIRNEIPDVLRSLGACFRAGLSLMQAFQRVAGESHGTLREPFARAHHILTTGGTTSEALACLRENRSTPELAFVALALDVQHQTGGSMEHVLNAASDMVKSELELARSLSVQTAQARLSASIVSVMPFVLVALFSFVSQDFLSPFFESIAGLALLSVAICMQITGVLAVRQTLKVGE